MRVAESDPTEHLVQKGLDLHGGKAAGGSVLVHVLLEVVLEKLKHEVQLLLAVNDVLQPDDVLVLQLLEQGNLADCSGGHALILRVEADLLERNHLLAHAVARLVHHTVRSLADLFQL